MEGLKVINCQEVFHDGLFIIRVRDDKLSYDFQVLIV